MRTRHTAPRLDVSTALILLALLGNACAPLTAQERASARVQQALRSPDEILAQYAAERASSHGRAKGEIIRIFVHPAQYPRSTVEELLDGLERLALTSADTLVRPAAASLVGVAGWATSKSPLGGIVARQARIYRKTSDPMVRAAIVSSLTGAAETRPAAAFLRTIALQSSRRGDFPNAPVAAIRALTRLGDEGPATLRELHQSGQVHDREASAFLAQLSKTGYRLRS